MLGKCAAVSLGLMGFCDLHARIQSVFRASKIRRSRGLPQLSDTSRLHKTSDLLFGGWRAVVGATLMIQAQVIQYRLLIFCCCLLSAARGPRLVGPATSPHSPIPASQAPVEIGHSGDFSFFCPLPAAQGSCRTSSSINQRSCAEPPTTHLLGRVGRGSKLRACRW